MIPDYIDCKKTEIETCDWFYSKECPKTCPLYDFLGIGAMTVPPSKLERDVDDGVDKFGNKKI